GDDGWSLRAEHAFAGSDLVGRRADGSLAVGVAWPPVEVHHLVVEQKSRALDHDARAVALLQRVGVGHPHAVLVDDREMRGAVAFRAHLDVLAQVFPAPRLRPVYP